jgi:outer membrane protein OmpA-like peptidoglycan-associated protein
MVIRHSCLSRALTMAFLVSVFALSLANRPASAEVLSSKQISNELKLSKSRSMVPDPMKPEDKAFINSLRGRDRSLSPEDRDRIDHVLVDRPKVNLDISFDFDSADLTSKAEPQLNELGKALTGGDLVGAVIFLGGHTDGKGTEDYNQGLSERRVQTVRRFLVEHYHIADANFISAGYGKKGLKNTTDPLAAENRRVEIVNAADRDQASK